MATIKGLATLKVWSEAEVWNALADKLEETEAIPHGLSYPTAEDDKL